MQSSPRMLLRIVTSLGIIALSSACIFKAWEVFRFSLVEGSVAAASERAKIYSPWTDTSGVAARAMEGLLPRTGTGDNLANAIDRRNQLSRFLSIRPLSSAGWLLLAENKLSTGQPIDKVRGSLVMSALTGPHEGRVMLDRAVFGLTIWPLLSPELQQRITNDLAETLPVLGYLSGSGSEGLRLSIALSRRSKLEVENIKKSLRAAGVSTEQLSTIGL